MDKLQSKVKNVRKGDVNMVYTIKKKSISNYPNPTINCTDLCFLKQEDTTDEIKAVYWIPFQVDLVDCQRKGMTADQIESYIEQIGKEKFEAPEMQSIFAAIELGATLNIGSSSTTTTNTTDTTKTA